MKPQQLRKILNRFLRVVLSYTSDPQGRSFITLTPEQRRQTRHTRCIYYFITQTIMSEITQAYKVRHSLAHLLAMAALKKHPDAKLSIGPVIEGGFYYDIDFGENKIGDADLKDLQKTMKKLASQGLDFSQVDITNEEALEVFKTNEYKTELISDLIEKNEELTFYKTGEEFVDLCAGGHVENTKEIDTSAFRLERVAGAYWRGDENNKMLTRIYGVAFETKEELGEFDTMMREAEKRNHRKVGQELGLFSFSQLVGGGLPLWSPKGTILRDEIDRFVQELRDAKGYQKVTIPHLAKKELYETSGHWNKYSEDLFKVTTKDATHGDSKDLYVLKPMNCPHHTQIFDAEPRSYRDMPQRYSDTTMVYRAEQSGELSGLTRVLSITQDDAHVFCRKNQLKQELENVWDIVQSFYGKFGFDKMQVRLSFRDPKNLDKYIGDHAVWDWSERTIREIAEGHDMEIIDGPGEAAFYGPKLDFMASDSIGRQHQVATIQLDPNLPERFNLYCINEEGEQERIMMIHAAIAGSLERFSAVLIEHTAGAFPFRFSPTQVSVIPVNVDAHGARAVEVASALESAGFRVEYNADNNDGMGKMVRQAKKMKTPYWIIIGDADIEAEVVTLESRDTGENEQISLEDLIIKFTGENK